MKLLSSFLQLIRWQNLLFIIITQLLFYYCIYLPLLPSGIAKHTLTFWMLVAASVFIAAGGYAINDYFDVQIDAVNKPDRVLIDRIIKRRSAILWHWILSGTGLLLSFFISLSTGVWLITAINILCVIALWVYSSVLKKKLLAGNLVIAGLAAWVIFSVYVFTGAPFFSIRGWQTDLSRLNLRQYFKYAALYAGFAFIMTLIREVIKDLEDMDGDRKFGCRTMPIAWGVPPAKIFSAVWIIVCISALMLIQLYAWQSGRRVAAVYSTLVIIVPLIILLHRLSNARVSADYHRASTLCKVIMLTGIFSMLLLNTGL